MTPKGHEVIRDCHDLFHDPKGHGDLVWPSLWHQKVTGSLEVAVTYFMTQKVTVSFMVDMT